MPYDDNIYSYLDNDFGVNTPKDPFWSNRYLGGTVGVSNPTISSNDTFSSSLRSTVGLDPMTQHLPPSNTFFRQIQPSTAGHNAGLGAQLKGVGGAADVGLNNNTSIATEPGFLSTAAGQQLLLKGGLMILGMVTGAMNQQEEKKKKPKPLSKETIKEHKDQAESKYGLKSKKDVKKKKKRRGEIYSE